MEPKVNTDADEVRRKLLGLALCPRCREDKPEKEMEPVEHTVSKYKICEQCTAAILYGDLNSMTHSIRGKSSLESILKPKS